MSLELRAGLAGRRLLSTLVLYLSSITFTGFAVYIIMLLCGRDIALRSVPWAAVILALLQHLLMRRSASAAVSQVNSTLQVVGWFIPERVMEEEAGDLLERVHKMAQEGVPAWMIYVKSSASILWILVNAIRQVIVVAKRKAN